MGIEYEEFCKHFIEIENSIVIQKYLHENEYLIVEYKINEDYLDLNSYDDYDNKMMKDSIETVNNIHNIATYKFVVWQNYKVFFLIYT